MTKKDKKKIWTLGNFGDVWEGCGHTKLGQGSQRQAGGLRRLWEHRDLIWSLTSPQWGRTLEQWASGEKWGGGGRDRKYLGYSAEPQWLEPLVTPPPPPLTTPTHTNTPPPLTPTPCFSLCLLLTLTLLLLWWTFYALLNRMDSDTCFFFLSRHPPIHVVATCSISPFAWLTDCPMPLHSLVRGGGLTHSVTELANPIPLIPIKRQFKT